MTQELFQILILGLLGVILTAVLKRHSGELSILLSIGTTVIMAIYFFRLLQPVLSFVEELRELTGLDRSLFEPVLKCLGIGLLSQFSVNLCTDAGQTAIGRTIQVSGCILCLYVALPLFRGVLSLMGSLGT